MIYEKGVWDEPWTADSDVLVALCESCHHDVGLACKRLIVAACKGLKCYVPDLEYLARLCLSEGHSMLQFRRPTPLSVAAAGEVIAPDPS